MGSGKLPQRGQFEIWCKLKPQNSLQKYLIMRKSYQELQKGSNFEGAKIYSRRSIFMGGGAITPSPRIDAMQLIDWTVRCKCCNSQLLTFILQLQVLS